MLAMLSATMAARMAMFMVNSPEGCSRLAGGLGGRMTIRQTLRGESLHCAPGIFGAPLAPARHVDASHSRRQRDLARGSGVGRLQQRSPWPPARFLLPPAGRPTASSATHPRHGALVALGAHTHPAGMFVVTEAEAAAIRAVYEQRGEFSAAVELRRLFPAITDTAQARACARTIAGWKPLPVPLRPVPR